MRACMIGDKKATFHKWVHRAWVVEPSIATGGHPGGQMEMDVALVELEDGKMAEVYPFDIRFIDKVVAE